MKKYEISYFRKYDISYFLIRNLGSIALVAAAAALIYVYSLFGLYRQVGVVASVSTISFITMILDQTFSTRLESSICRVKKDLVLAQKVDNTRLTNHEF